MIRASSAEGRALLKAATPKRAKPAGDLADVLAAQARAMHLPEPIREYRFQGAGGRRWRFDLAWPVYLLAAEVDGAEWQQGRHNRGAGMAADNQKLNAALIDGWGVLQFTGSQVRSGYALATLEVVFRGV